MGITSNQQDFQTPFLVRNDQGEEAPAFAALFVTGYDEDTGAVTVTRPVAAGANPQRLIFNTESPIAAGQYGQALRAIPCLAYVSGSPAVGDSIGTAANQWYLTTGQTGLVTWGETADGVVLVNMGCGC